MSNFKKAIFMGTPDFAVESLKQLLLDGINIVAVITAPDRKSGRGQKVSMSAVKNFALEKELPILQPEKFKNDRERIVFAGIFYTGRHD